MLFRYLKAIEWIKKNEDKMTTEIWSDFREFSGKFLDWVATQNKDSKDAIESTVNAVRVFFSVFPKAKILKYQEEQRRE